MESAVELTDQRLRETRKSLNNRNNQYKSKPTVNNSPTNVTHFPFATTAIEISQNPTKTHKKAKHTIKELHIIHHPAQNTISHTIYLSYLESRFLVSPTSQGGSCLYVIYRLSGVTSIHHTLNYDSQTGDTDVSKPYLVTITGLQHAVDDCVARLLFVLQFLPFHPHFYSPHRSNSPYTSDPYITDEYTPEFVQLCDFLQFYEHFHLNLYDCLDDIYRYNNTLHLANPTLYAQQHYNTFSDGLGLSPDSSTQPVVLRNNLFSVINQQLLRIKIKEEAHIDFNTSQTQEISDIPIKMIKTLQLSSQYQLNLLLYHYQLLITVAYTHIYFDINNTSIILYDTPSVLHNTEIIVAMLLEYIDECLKNKLPCDPFSLFVPSYTIFGDFLCEIDPDQHKKSKNQLVSDTCGQTTGFKIVMTHATSLSIPLYSNYDEMRLNELLLGIYPSQISPTNSHAPQSNRKNSYDTFSQQRYTKKNLLESTTNTNIYYRVVNDVIKIDDENENVENLTKLQFPSYKSLVIDIFGHTRINVMRARHHIEDIFILYQYHYYKETMNNKVQNISYVVDLTKFSTNFTGTKSISSFTTDFSTTVAESSTATTSKKLNILSKSAKNTVNTSQSLTLSLPLTTEEEIERFIDTCYHEAVYMPEEFPAAYNTFLPSQTTTTHPQHPNVPPIRDVLIYNALFSINTDIYTRNSLKFLAIKNKYMEYYHISDFSVDDLDFNQKDCVAQLNTRNHDKIKEILSNYVHIDIFTPFHCSSTTITITAVNKSEYIDIINQIRSVIRDVKMALTSPPLVGSIDVNAAKSTTLPIIKAKKRKFVDLQSIDPSCIKFNLKQLVNPLNPATYKYQTMVWSEYCEEQGIENIYPDEGEKRPNCSNNRMITSSQQTNSDTIDSFDDETSLLSQNDQFVGLSGVIDIEPPLLTAFPSLNYSNIDPNVSKNDLNKNHPIFSTSFYSISSQHTFIIPQSYITLNQASVQPDTTKYVTQCLDSFINNPSLQSKIATLIASFSTPAGQLPSVEKKKGHIFPSSPSQAQHQQETSNSSDPAPITEINPLIDFFMKNDAFSKYCDDNNKILDDLDSYDGESNPPNNDIQSFLASNTKTASQRSKSHHSLQKHQKSTNIVQKQKKAEKTQDMQPTSLQQSAITPNIICNSLNSLDLFDDDDHHHNNCDDKNGDRNDDGLFDNDNDDDLFENDNDDDLFDNDNDDDGLFSSGDDRTFSLTANRVDIIDLVSPVKQLKQDKETKKVHSNEQTIEIHSYFSQNDTNMMLQPQPALQKENSLPFDSSNCENIWPSGYNCKEWTHRQPELSLFTPIVAKLVNSDIAPPSTSVSSPYCVPRNNHISKPSLGIEPFQNPGHKPMTLSSSDDSHIEDDDRVAVIVGCPENVSKLPQTHTKLKNYQIFQPTDTDFYFSDSDGPAAVDHTLNVTRNYTYRDYYIPKNKTHLLIGTNGTIMQLLMKITDTEITIHKPGTRINRPSQPKSELNLLEVDQPPSRYGAPVRYKKPRDKLQASNIHITRLDIPLAQQQLTLKKEIDSSKMEPKFNNETVITISGTLKNITKCYNYILIAIYYHIPPPTQNNGNTASNNHFYSKSLVKNTSNKQHLIFLPSHSYCTTLVLTTEHDPSISNSQNKIKNPELNPHLAYIKAYLPQEIWCIQQFCTLISLKSKCFLNPYYPITKHKTNQQKQKHHQQQSPKYSVMLQGSVSQINAALLIIKSVIDRYTQSLGTEQIFDPFITIFGKTIIHSSLKLIPSDLHKILDFFVEKTGNGDLKGDNLENTMDFERRLIMMHNNTSHKQLVDNLKQIENVLHIKLHFFASAKTDNNSERMIMCRIIAYHPKNLETTMVQFDNILSSIRNKTDFIGQFMCTINLIKCQHISPRITPHYLSLFASGHKVCTSIRYNIDPGTSMISAFHAESQQNNYRDYDWGGMLNQSILPLARRYSEDKDSINQSVKYDRITEIKLISFDPKILLSAQYHLIQQIMNDFSLLKLSTNIIHSPVLSLNGHRYVDYNVINNGMLQDNSVNPVNRSEIVPTDTHVGSTLNSVVRVESIKSDWDCRHPVSKHFSLPLRNKKSQIPPTEASRLWIKNHPMWQDDSTSNSESDTPCDTYNNHRTNNIREQVLDSDLFSEDDPVLINEEQSTSIAYKTNNVDLDRQQSIHSSEIWDTSKKKFSTQTECNSGDESDIVIISTNIHYSATNKLKR